VRFLFGEQWPPLADWCGRGCACPPSVLPSDRDKLELLADFKTLALERRFCAWAAPDSTFLEPFRYYQYGKRTVHLDGCVEVGAAYYGAPPGWIGREVHGLHRRSLQRCSASIELHVQLQHTRRANPDRHLQRRRQLRGVLIGGSQSANGQRSRPDRCRASIRDCIMLFRLIAISGFVHWLPWK
jgi:hypothetical protein